MNQRLPPRWRHRARETLFGTAALPKRLLLTPFMALLDDLPGVYHQGWWPACTIDDVAVVRVPQGSPSTDAVAALESGHEITFIGLCGSLIADLSPGTLVEVETAQTFNGVVAHRAWVRPPTLVTARVATVSSLADSTLRHDTLRLLFDCVEMETAWILAAAQANQCPARAILAISDTNHDGDVFSSQAHETTAALRAAMRHALDEW